MVGALALVLAGPDTLTPRVADAAEDGRDDLLQEVRDDRYPGSVPGFGYGYPPAGGSNWGERRNFVPPPTVAPQIAPPIMPPQPGPFDDLLEKHGLAPARPIYPYDPPGHRGRDSYRHQRPGTTYYYFPAPSITLSPCQQSVGESLRDRFGTGTMSFSGSPHQGIVTLGRRSFNFRCTPGQVNVW